LEAPKPSTAVAISGITFAELPVISRIITKAVIGACTTPAK
jgi:hypothetical protein